MSIFKNGVKRSKIPILHDSRKFYCGAYHQVLIWKRCSANASFLIKEIADCPKRKSARRVDLTVVKDSICCACTNALRRKWAGRRRRWNEEIISGIAGSERFTASTECRRGHGGGAGGRPPERDVLLKLP